MGVAAGGRWTLDWNGMEEAMRKHPETALLMLCNPYNPVGEPDASRGGAEVIGFTFDQTAYIVHGGWGGMGLYFLVRGKGISGGCFFAAAAGIVVQLTHEM